ADGIAAGVARGRMARDQLELDRLLCIDGRAQPLGGLQLRPEHLGQLQAIRRHGADGAVHPRPGRVPRPAHEDRRGRRMTSGTGTGTGITTDALRARLAETLAPSQLEVLDESWQHEGHAGADGTGFGTHFRVRIASPKFAGLTKVAQHRLVYD